MIAETFGDLALSDCQRKWCLSGLAPHVALRLKAMFPRINKAITGAFLFPNTDEGCMDLDWFLHRFPLRMADEHAFIILEGVARDAAKRETARGILASDWKPSAQRGFREGMAPYPYQAQNASLALAMGRLLIMDDVGLGKTISALAALAGSDHLPAAIVVQSHLPTQWVEEYIKKFTTLTWHIIKSTRPYELPNADLYVFKYSNIAGWVDVAATGAFSAVVYDEIQELRRGRSSAKGAAAAVFSANAELKIGLSATPIFNYGEEIFHVVEYIAPGVLGEFHDFVREWCGQGRVVKNPDALGTYLRDQHIAVRRESAGNPVNTIAIEVPYDYDVEAAELDLVRTLAIRVVSGSFVERGQAARELDMKLREITGIAKARHVAAYVRILLEAGQSVLLAGWHREVYAIWQRELAAFKPLLYTGSETQKQKDEHKRAFIARESQLMVISLRSGAGVDGLQKVCDTVVIGELDWSPKVHDQVIGRLDRPGQLSDEVTAIYLHADGGSDPLMVGMLGLKASQSKGIVDPLSGPQEVHTDESRIRALAKDFLARHAVKPEGQMSLLDAA